MTGRVIDFDCETTGLQWPYHEAFLYQFGDEDGNVEVIPYTERDRIQAWFDKAKDGMIRAWNARFDRHFAQSAGFDIPGDKHWIDGMIGAHTIDERRSVALKAVGDSLGFSEGKDLQKEVKDWLTHERARRKAEAKETGIALTEPNYSDVPSLLMNPYACEDVHLTRKVCAHQDPIIAKSPDLQRIVDFEHEVFDALYAVERLGFPVDDEGYRRLEIEVCENLERMDDTLNRLAAVGVTPDDLDDFEFNPKSPKQVLSALKRRGADLSFVTGESMDAENLNTVEDELAKEILAFRAEFKALSTYIRPYIDRSYEVSIRSWKEPFICPDGRIHANYRQLGARTGRMSCSDPNIQNQPRDDLRLRYNYRAEPGMKLVTCDLNSVEMAVFAAYAGEGRIMDAVKAGADLHQMTADFVGIRDRARAGGAIESARQRGKTFNFAVIYGAGVRSMRKMMRCSQADARMYLKRYHDAYPEVARLQARVEWRLEDTGYIKSALGRRFRIDSRDAYRGVNYLVQGTAAEILKAALIKCHKQGLPVVALVHDEVIAHVPEADAEEARHTIIENLCDFPQIAEKVPLTADGDIVDRWSQAKKPDFKPRWAGGDG